jgi:NADH-quinone oxidoreductase subunit G
MANLVNFTVDDIALQVPAGMLVVDAAKRAGIDIPVFCYHPKLSAVGMCRMCLVEVGTPKIDPATKQPMVDGAGNAVIAWQPKLTTACTTPVSPGMAVRTQSAAVKAAQKDVLEFLLTSHPLDCPICQKGGECPLQNLTLRHGPAVSRFPFDEKQRLDKHKPLGDLIFLDEERCIQCSRCIRFQDEIAEDHVLGFDQRGRALQIVTFSEPGFDSKFSGNTTDICPVGALLTIDYHHSPRPWETKSVPSICPHCAVGCNLALATRVNHNYVARVMPRQNEQVNEIWICDKGRFGAHFVARPDRLQRPLIRRNGQLVEATWDEALAAAAELLKAAGSAVGGIAGDRLSNEDLFTFQALVRQVLRSPHVDQWPRSLDCGELVAQIGLASGSNVGDWGADTAVLVIASDLEEEAPIWWLRVNAAARRGAKLVVANGRRTKTDRCAVPASSLDPRRGPQGTHVLRYRYGTEVAVLNALLRAVLDAGLENKEFTGTRVDGLPALRERLAAEPAVEGLPAEQLAAAARTLAEARNLVVIFGGEGLSPLAARNLAQAAGNLLIVTGHVGRPNNGLLPVWPHNNTQGAWDMGVHPGLLPGYRPAPVTGKDIAALLVPGGVQALLVAGADPAGETPQAAEALRTLNALIVCELFMTETAKLAHVVFPAQAFAEREGTYTGGDRRVQRFYPAVRGPREARPDWQIFTGLAARLGTMLPSASAAAVMARITQDVPQYAGMNYTNLSQVVEQFPDVGGTDLYYGGNAYHNTAGLGVVWPVPAENPAARMRVAYVTPPARRHGDALPVVPVTRLYDGGALLAGSPLAPHVPGLHLELHAADAARLGIADGADVMVHVGGRELHVRARLDEHAPEGAALLPRDLAGIGELDGPGELVGHAQKARG